MTHKYLRFITVTLVFILSILFSSYHKKASQSKIAENISLENMEPIENMFKDELENGTWITNKILGLDPNSKQYVLTKFIEQKFAGNLTSFSNKLNFSSRYVAPCGNDNFTTIIGKHNFIDQNKISISVDSVIYSGAWKRPNEFRESENIIFVISKISDSIILTKQI
ncbi:hypothetical protein JBL43_16460 [Aureibaculum sp. A20]|uniref:Uncharacterized protein n=1 Tax=Aureibaculum flavum TaxID=2795986 RepID=A0ABS0WVI0_9FLAO|nr:hypothetical protein [Aureibaculum flavum]MBJ2175848.1 hypothetical protein [Aureibaculum flavum]